MANEQNLRPSEYKFTQEDVKKGQKRSAEVRRKRSEFKKTAETILGLLANDKEYADIEKVRSIAELHDKNVTVEEAILLAQASRAMKGNTKAAEFIRDTAGQKPVEKVMVSEVELDVIEEVERMVLEDD